MANLSKYYANHFGLDLKSSDITREPQYASDMRNAEYKKNGNISKREGYRGAGGSVGGAGLHSYTRINPTTAAESQTLLAVDENLHRLVETTVLIQYTGAEASVQIDIYLDKVAGVYKTGIVEGTTTVLDYNMGSGIDDPTPQTLADLKTQIEAISGDYSVTITGDDTSSAAYVDLVRSVNLAVDDVEIIGRKWEQVESPLATVFPGNATYEGDDDFYSTTSAQLNNNIYFSNGYDDVIKYDGQNAYRAGLPQPGAAPSVALGGAGLLNPTDPAGYRWAYRYTQIDANLNEHSGIITAESTALNPSSQSVDVTVDNILAASGFNTNAAVVAGAQVGVNTITVDDGSGGNHTFVVGDTAYFYDGVLASYVTREITAVTAGTITIAGAAVNVADNEVMSNNLRIQIYRNLDGGTFLFLVEELANNPFTATQVYNDNKVDSALGIQYLQPLVFPGLPPKGRYLSSYNNQLFSAGDLENPNTVSWSDVDRPEAWQTELYSLRIQSPNGEKITGLSQNNEVMTIFEKRAMHVISGDIPKNNIRVDTLTKDIGCVSHNTIQEVRGSLYFLSDRGVWQVTSGQLPLQVSEKIEPFFDFDNTLPDDETPILKRSLAINDRDKEQYVLFIPTEDVNLVGLYSNANSIILVEDYYRGAWLRWSNLNMSGGAAYHQNKLFWTERRFIDTTTLGHHLYSKNNRGDSWDYQDSLEPVPFEYATSWYHFNEPSVFKKFMRLKTFASQETANNAFIIETDIEKNFVPGLVAASFTVDFSAGTEGYGVSPYGTAPYGDLFFPDRKCKIGPIKATAIRFVFRNDEDCSNVDINGWELEVAFPYRAELK